VRGFLLFLGLEGEREDARVPLCDEIVLLFEAVPCRLEIDGGGRKRLPYLRQDLRVCERPAGFVNKLEDEVVARPREGKSISPRVSRA
jgi:hypothetical protein